MSYSNAPVGLIFNSYNGGYSPISSSYYTPLTGIFYGSSIPGYSQNQQPIWLPYIKNGQFQNGIDIIALNGAILNFGTTSSPLSNSLTSLKIFSSNSNNNQFVPQELTSLLLVGENCDTTPFTSSTSFSLLHINSVPVIGYFQPSSVVSTTLSPVSGTQTIAVRFSLFLLGEQVNAPLTITANGENIANVPINTNGYLQNVELQFPCNCAQGQPVTLSITFGSTNTPFQWAMSQVAISYSPSPVGTIYSTQCACNVPLTNSYFTTLLQNYLGGSFPGYSAAQQPIWLSYVQNGQYNNALDIIVVNSQSLNFATASPYAIRNSLIQASFLNQSPIILEIVGSNFKFPSFSINSGTLASTTIGSIPALGQFSPSAILSYTLAPLGSTQSVNIRFMLFISGNAENAPFTLNANNIEVLTVPTSCSSCYRNVEVQFPYTIGAAQNSLTFTFGPSSSSQSFQWAVGQMAISYSSAPVGFIFNAPSLGYSPVQGSYFTPALSNYYGSSFPNYSSAQQPVWTQYVLNGQFNNNVDVIALNGNVLNFAPYTIAIQNSNATPLNGELSSLSILLENNVVQSNLPQLSTVLELIGFNFNTSPFTCSTGACSTNYIEEVPVLGNFMSSTTVSYSLAPLTSTQAIIVRFNLHTIGTLSAVPLSLTFNSVSVLLTPITSSNSIHYVEVNFPYTNNGNNNNQYTLTITFTQPQQNLNNFQWAISQFAVTYSNAPVGYIPNSVTGEYNAITTSFHTILLPTYYNGAYPGYSTQPTWVSHVLSGQFVNSIDIIAINGHVLNFGRYAPNSVGILELTSIPQSSSSMLNYLPYTQNVGNQMQYGGVTQPSLNLFDFSPLVIDLVGTSLSNIEQWTINGNNGNLNTIYLNSINNLGYFSPGVVLTRQYLNLGNYKSLAVIFHLSVASPTGFNFRVQANGITIVQQALQAGTYDQILEAQFEIPEQNVVLTFGAYTESGVSPSNAGGWAIGSVGFLNNQCDIKNFYDLNTNRCQYAGNSVFYPLTFVNYRQGFAHLTAQPTWYLAFVSNNVGTPNQYYFINNANVPYLTGSESSVVSPTSIHQLQYALLGGNRIYIDLVGEKWNLQRWSLNTGSVQTAPLGNYQVLGVFNFGQTLTFNLETTPVHATVVLRFRLNIVGDWNQNNFYTTLNGAQILVREFTVSNDYRDIEIQFVHTAPTLELIFGVNTNSATAPSGAGFAISNLVLHLNPCSVHNIFSVLLNQCMQTGTTAVYSLYRTDYFGQFNNNAGLNLIYLNKFQGIFGLNDDGKEIYSSWTGENNVFPGEIIVELTGPNFDISNWQVRETRQAPYTSQLYGSYLLGPFESVTVLRRVWTDIPAHTSVTGRLRLYLVGAWIDQNTILQVNGNTVFQYVLGSTDTYQDIEFAFDHTSTTLDFSILSSSTTSAGAREGIQFGISDIALYLSPCAQQNFFDVGLGACSQTTGYSTFYNLVQNNLDGWFPTVSLRPLWIIVLTPVSGISQLAHEVYSFLRGSQLEVIMGVNGKPQFEDLDLLERLKQQIDDKRVVSSNNTYDLSFLSGRSSQNIIGNYTNGTITSYGQSYDNLFGASFAQANVTKFEFAFGIVTGWACVGLIETQDMASLDLNSDLRNQSLVVCSDDLTQPETKFLVNIDTSTNTISFQDQFYNQSTTLNFNDASDLYYTVQFYEKGTAYFGSSADNYQKGGLSADN